jgi:hypothetical protein
MRLSVDAPPHGDRGETTRQLAFLVLGDVDDLVTGRGR